jgi:hypothetical protein
VIHGKKSPEGLTMIELKPGAQTITLTYQAPLLLRLSYAMSLLLWLLVFFLIVRFFSSAFIAFF